MARGWESKSVEAQLGEAAASRQAAPREDLTPEQTEQHRKRELLVMARKRTQQLLAEADNPRYRELLQRELKALEDQIAEL